VKAFVHRNTRRPKVRPPVVRANRPRPDLAHGDDRTSGDRISAGLMEAAAGQPATAVERYSAGDGGTAVKKSAWSCQLGGAVTEPDRPIGQSGRAAIGAATQRKHNYGLPRGFSELRAGHLVV
jgi:hypothetical protein